jgi:hypothetical protein
VSQRPELGGSGSFKNWPNFHHWKQRLTWLSSWGILPSYSWPFLVSWKQAENTFNRDLIWREELPKSKGFQICLAKSSLGKWLYWGTRLRISSQAVSTHLCLGSSEGHSKRVAQWKYGSPSYESFSRGSKLVACWLDLFSTFLLWLL